MGSVKPVIVVVHATSKQGTSVVSSLLRSGNFAVKALVRDATADNAKLLAGKGAEVIAVDAMDAAQLRAAFDGAYGVFFVTVPYVIFAGKEFEQGKLVSDTAAAAGVKVFVFSTLEDVEKRSQGRYIVKTFTDKARIEEYVKETHGGMIGIFPAVAGFYTNWVSLNTPRKDEDGVLVFAVPARGDLPRAWVNPYTAMGPIAVAAFSEPEKYRNRFIPVYDEYMSCDEMVKVFTEVTGLKARFQQLSKDDMSAAMPPNLVDILWPMYRYVEELGYYSPARDMQLVRNINPHPSTWEDFLKTSGFDGTQSEDEIRGKFA